MTLNARLAQDINCAMKEDLSALGIAIRLKDDDKLNEVCVKLFDFDADSDLQKDLEKIDGKCIDIEMVFPQDYPFKPPEVFIIQPPFISRTGHITAGGSICTELLTLTGWSSVYDIQSICLHLRLTILAGDGRVDFSRIGKKYTRNEGREAFRRVATDHHWKIE